jgi:hypothetical protein
MRKNGVSRFVPTNTATAIGAFQGVVALVLRDGVLTREEKRLVIKLAGLLELDDDVPKKVYDAVTSGDVIEEGELLTSENRLNIYAELFETAFLNASISEDEYVVVAYLRHYLNITEEEHENVVRDLQKTMEEHVEKNMFDVVEKGLDQAIDRVNNLFLKIRSILPEGGK